MKLILLAAIFILFSSMAETSSLPPSNVFFVYVSTCTNWFLPCTKWKVNMIKKVAVESETSIGHYLYEHCQDRYFQMYNSLSAPCDAYKYRVLNTIHTFSTNQHVYKKDSYIQTSYWLEKRFLDSSMHIQSLIEEKGQNTWIVLVPIRSLREN